MSSDTVLPPFRVTAAAIDEIEALGGAIRVDVHPGGCSGYTYVYSLACGESAPTDQRFGCPGAWLDVSEKAAAVLSGATLDYGRGLKPPRFRVLRNPNTPEVCACRRSFGEPWPGPKQPNCASYLPMPWDDGFEPPAPWRRQTGFRREERPGKP